MIKTLFGGLTIFIAVGLIFSSCEKKLDLYPHDSVELSKSLKTIKDATAFDNGIIGGVKGRQYGLFMFSQDIQGDQLNASLDYGNRNGNPHRWGSSFLADDYTIRDTWSSYYFLLKNINQAIAQYPTIQTSNSSEKALLDRYLGNAHIARAFIYSELIIRWGKPYAPTTANTDLGVPIVLTYDISFKPARATVKAVYDQILNDLSKSEALLSSVVGVQGSTRFTIHSVKALEARVRLNMQDWAGAKNAAGVVISSNVYTLYNTSAGLNSMWKADAKQETIQQGFVNSTELANANVVYLGLQPGSGKFIPDFIPSQWVIDKYANNDIRKNVYFEKKLCYFQGTDYPNIWLVNKYPGNPSFFTSATTNYQHAPKVFRVAELYLIAAEAGAKLGGAEEATALMRLNELKAARGLSASLGLTGASLINEIKDERFRELAFEGFRLWDLKRWHDGFTRSTPQNTNILQVGPNFTTLSIAADDPKFVWAIPTNDMTTNPGLAGQQNPGW